MRSAAHLHGAQFLETCTKGKPAQVCEALRLGSTLCLQHHSRVVPGISLLRTSDDVHRLPGRKNYLFSGTKGIYNPTLNVHYGWKKWNLTHWSSVIPLLCLPEMLQCQRVQDFLHMRQDPGPLLLQMPHPLSGMPFLSLLCLGEFLVIFLNPSSGVPSSRKPSQTLPAGGSFLDLGSIAI